MTYWIVSVADFDLVWATNWFQLSTLYTHSLIYCKRVGVGQSALNKVQALWALKNVSLVIIFAGDMCISKISYPWQNTTIRGEAMLIHLKMLIKNS